MAAKWIPEVQGVRTLALALVAAYHVWFGKVSGGVDVFLFISAFLLTRSMITSVERGATPRPCQTILRRFARLLPLTLTAVLLIVAASLLWLPTSETPMILTQGFASTTYWENVYLQLQQIDYFAVDRSTASPFQHYWSLAVQGQVFVVWPLLFALLYLLARSLRLNVRKVALIGFGAVLMLGFAYSVYATDVNQQAAYFSMFARVWEFAAGSVLALALPWLRVPGPAKAVFGWAGVLGIVLCGWVLPVEASFPGWAALWPVLSAVLVVLSAGAAPRYGAGVLLNHPFMQRAANYSFALYLTHWPVLVIYLFVARVDSVSFLEGAGLLGISAGLAWLLTKLVEEPVAEFLAGRQTPKRMRGLGSLARAGVVVVALPAVTLATLGVGQGIASARMHEARTEAGAMPVAEYGANALDLDSGPLWPSELIVRDDLAPLPPCDQATLASINAELDKYCMGDGNAGTWVVGNSQAQQAIPLVTGPVRAYVLFECQFGGEGVRPEIEDECDAFWGNITEQILEDKPATVVVLATRSYEDDSEAELPGIVDWIDRITDAGIHVVALRDAPRTTFNPFMCTEQWGVDADRCGFTTSLSTPNIDLQERIEAAGGEYVDRNPLICPDGECTPVRGGVYVFMDSSHVTATYMRTVTAALARE